MHSRRGGSLSVVMLLTGVVTSCSSARLTVIPNTGVATSTTLATTTTANAATTTSTTAAPETTQVTDTTAAPTTTVERPAVAGGIVFDDPQGKYSLTVAATWVQPSAGGVNGIEFWRVGPRSNGFTPNLNVLTQNVPGITLADYIEISKKQTLGLKILSASTFRGVHGNVLGRMDYEGKLPNSTLLLRFIAVFAVSNGVAVVATFTAVPAEFSALLPSVLPYLRTLQAT